MLDKDRCMRCVRQNDIYNVRNELMILSTFLIWNLKSVLYRHGSSLAVAHFLHSLF